MDEAGMRAMRVHVPRAPLRAGRITGAAVLVP